MENSYNNLKLAERGARLSIITYIVLSTIKLFIGYYTNSKALTADGFNNATDILASVAVLIGLRISRKPPDENHPYGHFKAETVASLIASIIMVGVGVNVIIMGVQSVFVFNVKAPELYSSFVAFFSGIIIYSVYQYNRRIAIKIKSSGLLAASKDNRNDALVSFAAGIGIIGSQFNMPWLDPVLAVLVGVLIIKTGFDIFRETSHNLTDGFHNDEINKISEIINNVEGVSSVKDVRARRYGSNIVIDIVIGVDPKLTIEEAHQITERVEEHIKEQFDIIDTIIHIEPDIE